MRGLLSIILGCTLIGSLLALDSPARADDERRVALVIGNGAYQNAPRLANPANDARLIADTLKSVGFELVGGKPLIDGDKPALERAIRAFGQALRGGAVGLFYYSGHGVQINGANYLVPVTANVAEELDAKFELVDAGLVLDAMANARNRLNIMILDACRNNPFGGRGLRDIGAGLAQVTAPAGTVISYATQPGNVASDGTGNDSPYTTALATAIKQPARDIFATFNEVGLRVKETTKGQQQPWLSTSPIEGQFFFVPGETDEARQARIAGEQFKAQADAAKAEAVAAKAAAATAQSETALAKAQAQADSAARTQAEATLAKMQAEMAAAKAATAAAAKAQADAEADAAKARADAAARVDSVSAASQAAIAKAKSDAVAAQDKADAISRDQQTAEKAKSDAEAARAQAQAIAAKAQADAAKANAQAQAAIQAELRAKTERAKTEAGIAQQQNPQPQQVAMAGQAVLSPAPSGKTRFDGAWVAEKTCGSPGDADAGSKTIEVRIVNGYLSGQRNREFLDGNVDSEGRVTLNDRGINGNALQGRPYNRNLSGQMDDSTGEASDRRQGKLCNIALVRKAGQPAAVVQPASVTSAALGVNSSSPNLSGPSNFDGTWRGALACTKFENTEGYNYNVNIMVANGHLTGQYGTFGKPNSTTFQADIQPDGTATIHAIGLSGNPKATIGGIPEGTPVKIDFSGQLTDSGGTFTRVKDRPCTLTFSRTNAVTDLPMPAGLNERRQESFQSFLASKANRAFAMSVTGHTGWASGRRTPEEASKAAIENCQKNSGPATCSVIYLNDAKVQ